MKSFALLLIGAALAFGQQPDFPTAVYPGRVATSADLEVAANTLQLQLTAPLGPSDTSLTTTNTASMPNFTEVSIANEIIRICGVTDTFHLAVCSGGRGAEGTSAISHLANSAVQLRYTAGMHNQAMSEIIALEKRENAATILITDPRFAGGAKCDGVTDDAPAVQAAIDYVHTFGGRISGPNLNDHPGWCMLGSSVNIKRGADLDGFNNVGTVFAARAGGTFATTTVSGITCPTTGGTACKYLFQMAEYNGSGGRLDSHYMAVKNLTILGNGLIDIGIWAPNQQELAMIDHVFIGDYLKYGILVGGQNFLIHDTYQTAWCGTNPATAATGIEINFNTLSRIHISDVTIANFCPQTGSGVEMSTDYGVDVDDIHIENAAIGLYAHGNGNVRFRNVFGNGTVPTLVQLGNGTSDHLVATLMGLVGNGSAVTVCETGRAGTGTCGGFTNVTALTQDVSFRNGTQGENFYSSLQGETSNFKNLSVFTTFDLTAGVLKAMNGSNQVMAFNPNTFALAATQGNGINTGIVLQSMPTYNAGGNLFAGGGLHLQGNGLTGLDPSYGLVESGATSEGGTWTAKGTSAEGVILNDGSLAFYANQGLSSGITFGPNIKFSVDPNGLKVQPSASTPTCAGTGANVGTVWINTSVTPHRVEFCVNQGGTFGWSYATLTAGP